MTCVEFAKVEALLRSSLLRGHASPQHSRKNRLGRHGDLQSDAIQPRRIIANISKTEQYWQEAVFVVGTGRYVVGIPSINKSSDGSHARLHNPSCSMYVQKSNSEQ